MAVLTRKDLTSETWKRVVAFLREAEAKHLTTVRSVTVPERIADAARGRLLQIDEILALDPRLKRGAAPGKQPEASDDAEGDPFELTRQRAQE